MSDSELREWFHEDENLPMMLAQIKACSGWSQERLDFVFEDMLLYVWRRRGRMDLYDTAVALTGHGPTAVLSTSRFE